MATTPPPGDPRPFARLPGESGALPVVARPRGGPSNLAIGIGIAAAGLILFAVLDSRRRETASPAVRVRAADRVQMASPPPPLYVPPVEPAPALVPAVRLPEAATPVPPPPPPPPQVVYVPQAQPYYPPPAPPQQEAPPPPPRVATGPALVFDGSPGGAGAAGAQADSAPVTSGVAGVAGGRARSGAFANRGTTVPQGTLIPAVLETALDSTRPGLARAIVSRDVRGFDGSRILIPRGSRLIGEYRSEVARGQHRALVNWIRLIRPDGVTIAIGSPASDTFGRAGIRAKVNSHFFERFAGAILQSAFDIGVNLASRAGNGTTVILPSGLQGTTQIIQPGQITPTLKVKAGTSISIFAARDLDFSTAENRR
ncbi:MAG: type secretion system protein VirB10 [Sphingomonadales bacterium]|jgi:type IV secretion system protein VirB10|nr:type secretion system protein VirB10 [Sphingomonadales bacterium]